MKKRILAMALALVLVACVAVAGTVAWLTAETTEVTNTFVVGDINIDLKEHDLVNGALDMNNPVISEDTYKILPGTEQPKDPFVTVKKGSEACYVFVQVKEVNNFVKDENGDETAAKYVNWTKADGWTELGTANGITTYYREQDALTADDAVDAVYYVLAGKSGFVNGYVSYDGTLTAGDLEAAETAQPKLIFKAFAVQKEVGTVEEAWNAVTSSEKLAP